MVKIHYLSEQDRIDALRKYERPVIEFSKFQLQMALIFLLNGLDLDQCLEFILLSRKQGGDKP